MASSPISTVISARKEGESGARLRYVGVELEAPFLALVIHLNPQFPDPPDELTIGVNAYVPTPTATVERAEAERDNRRMIKLEAELTTLRDRLIKAQAQNGLLQRRLSGLLAHRAVKAGDAVPSVVDLYREVLAEERREDKERKTRSTDKRFVKKRR